MAGDVGFDGDFVAGFEVRDGGVDGEDLELTYTFSVRVWGV